MFVKTLICTRRINKSKICLKRRKRAIRVLKNNSKDSVKDIKPYPRKLVCESCKSELEYDESDLRMGEYGCVYVGCPICGQDNMLENDEHSITLTKDNIEFPLHFHHVCKKTGAKDICNQENIRKRIKDAIKYFRKNKSEYDYGCWFSGNLYLHVHRYSDDENYTVTVSNDFYEMEIPFEEEDYDYGDSITGKEIKNMLKEDK